MPDFHYTNPTQDHWMADDWAGDGYTWHNQGPVRGQGVAGPGRPLSRDGARPSAPEGGGGTQREPLQPLGSREVRKAPSEAGSRDSQRSRVTVVPGLRLAMMPDGTFEVVSLPATSKRVSPDARGENVHDSKAPSLARIQEHDALQPPKDNADRVSQWKEHGTGGG